MKQRYVKQVSIRVKAFFKTFFLKLRSIAEERGKENINLVSEIKKTREYKKWKSSSSALQKKSNYLREKYGISHYSDGSGVLNP